MAGLGALIAMLVIALINFMFNRDFGREMKESFKIPKGDKPLGEVRLMEFFKRKCD